MLLDCLVFETHVKHNVSEQFQFNLEITFIQICSKKRFPEVIFHINLIKL
jgi:hypothetical protein